MFREGGTGGEGAGGEGRGRGGGRGGSHQLLWTACLESSRSCIYLLNGVFGFTLILLPKVSSFFSFPISTSARDSPTCSMSSPMGATSRFKIFVGLTNALLCHLLLTVLRKTMINNVHIVGLCGFHLSVQVKIENVVFEIHGNELVRSFHAGSRS